MPRSTNGLCAAALAGLAAALGGCAMSDAKLGSMVADPMQYEFYTCQQLANTATGYKARLDELDGLMAKSSTGAGGGVVNALAYKPEYVTVTGQLNAIHSTQADKNCETPPAPAPAAKPAAPKRR